MLYSIRTFATHHCPRDPAIYLHSKNPTSWIAVSLEAKRLLPRLLQRVGPWAWARMVAGEVRQVAVETLPSETQKAMVVTGLMQMAIGIPNPAATAMVDNRMTADQHGDLILGYPQGPRLPVVSIIITTTIILTIAGDQMGVMDTGLGLTIWIAVVSSLPKGTGPLRLMSTHIYQATARTAGGVREKIVLEKTVLEKTAPEMNAREMNAQETTAEDGMIEIEIGYWTTMSAAGPLELVAAVEVRPENEIGRECVIESRWTGTGIGTEMLTADKVRRIPLLG